MTTATKAEALFKVHDIVKAKAGCGGDEYEVTKVEKCSRKNIGGGWKYWCRGLKDGGYEYLFEDEIATKPSTPEEKAKEEVREMLVKNAVDCTFYVAAGNCAAEDLAAKYGMTKTAASGMLSVVACELVDKIRALVLEK